MVRFVMDGQVWCGIARLLLAEHGPAAQVGYRRVAPGASLQRWVWSGSAWQVRRGGAFYGRVWHRRLGILR